MKYKSHLITGACLAALALCTPPILSAKGKKSPALSAGATATASPAASPEKAPRALPYHGTISAVDQSAKTFTIAGKENSRVFKVSDRTVITKDGNPAIMTDLVANEPARGSYWKAVDGSLEAKTVKLGAKMEMKKASKKKMKDESMASPLPSATP
jgi:hypothetical protein